MPQTASRSKNRPKNKAFSVLSPVLAWLTSVRLRIKLGFLVFAKWLRRKANRSTFANIFMFCFIILTSIGAGMIFLPAGFVVAGVGCGIFGFLLGLE